MKGRDTLRFMSWFIVAVVLDLGCEALFGLPQSGASGAFAFAAFITILCAIRQERA